MKTYGLIGYPLSHSFSQKYFTEKFLREGITEVQYLNYPIPSVGDLKGLLKQNPELAGLNVTIPYKEQVLPYLDFVDPVAEAVGACNCIRVEQGKLHGFNTDVEGFRLSLLKKLQPHHTQALVLGEGGAAKAVRYALKSLGIEFLTVSRRGNELPGIIQYNQLNREVMDEFYLVINTTPLGTFPDIEQAPQIPYDALGPKHYLFDLVYNPSKTLFLKSGEERGAVIENGAEMLSIQAEESWRIWNVY